MRCVVQKVSRAAVRVESLVVGQIEKGILAFVGIDYKDTEQDINWLADKLIGLRIFEDNQGKMNLSVKDIQGEILLVSQFTLLGDCRKGKRPNFSDAASSDMAKNLFDKLIAKIKEKNINVETGKFQTKMDVELINDGPVTILLDSKKNF